MARKIIGEFYYEVKNKIYVGFRPGYIYSDEELTKKYA